MIKKIFITIVAGILLNACGTTAEDILKKYDSYGELQTEADEARVCLEMKAGVPTIKYSSPLLNTSEEYTKILADRWFVADAENPDSRLSVKAGITTVNSTEDGVVQPVTYGNILALDNVKEKFLLIGFEGIASGESKEAEIPPLFFLVENKGAESKILTAIPKLAGELFAVNYVPTRFVEYLKVKEIRLQSTGLESLVVTDERGIEIIVTNLNKWFENVTVKNVIMRADAKIDLIVAPQFTQQAQLAYYSPSATEILLFEFNLNGKVYPIGVGRGTKFIITRSSAKNNILLLEETANLSPPPTIKKNDQIIIY